MNCRHCATVLEQVFLDLGSAPPSNAFLDAAALNEPESWFPLKLYVCDACRLVQVDEVQSAANLFAPDYVYFSSYSRSWLEHARRYVDQAVPRLGLGAGSLVVEIASNDGYLLQYVAARGIPCVGIEPTLGTAEAARARGIDTVVEFFGRRFAEYFVAQRGRADLIIANNVLAHVPELDDFVAGIALALADGGSVTLEFPHLVQLVAQRQFDTVYHEHFSYFSFYTVERVLAAHGLRIWDVEHLPTHGGSLRIWATHVQDTRSELGSVAALRAAEAAVGVPQADYYRDFQQQADAVKHGLLEFLLQQRRRGLRVAAYGAAAKGNTLLNYAGVRSDLLPYVVDASPHKQGRYLPGSRIPVVGEARLREDRPDLILILPWNLREEITAQLAYARDWGARFVIAVPEIVVS
ncbi:methyltransferase family protein [Tahibacter aquaticus]|uniref:Methyltransferase family protein n=1 Tax=Tahibacter aquaticus TaxID=520092 RepID=A0A4R6Z9V7_9GAMM|nr:class I SAM-dependent methyltransferase [Tahibacter aquaticus]TDR48708.1 methyltransferase family protein [Tahibacter aquaticus]